MYIHAALSQIKSSTMAGYYRGCLIAFVLPLIIGTCSVDPYRSDSRPVAHDIWDQLLKKYVTEAGNVDYQGFLQDTATLDAYLTILSAHHPNAEHWSREEQMAYWINAYNAFTINLVLDHYPVESIRDIRRGIPFVSTVWDIKFIRIEEREYDLNAIEHGILRPGFDDPRIHFAINCASVSCPALRKEAYMAERLDQQLTDQARRFLEDPAKNRISPDEIMISRIFSWFGGDFKKDGSLIDFLNRYAPTRIRDGARVRYMEYDWDLNDKATLE